MLYKFLALRGMLGGNNSAPGSSTEDQTYILVDEAGTEVTAVLVDEETTFDATANDIRLGKVAATNTGVTTGTKEIPAYYVSEGVVIIPAGSVYKIQNLERCDFTKLQALLCDFNSNLSNSVAASMVSINGKVYAVNSTEALANVTVEAENNVINLGVTNNGDTPDILRFFTYKEEY